MARPSLRQDEIDDFRERLCDAALRMFALHGHQNVTMRAIAKELGCSHTTPYRYFNNKDEIFISVRTRCFERFNQYQQDRRARVEGLHEQLSALASGYLAFAREFPEAFSIMFDLAQIDLEANQELKTAIQLSWNILHETLKDCVEEELLEGDPKQMTYLFWASFHGIAALGLASQLGPGWEPETITEPMLQTMIKAHSPTLPPLRSTDGKTRDHLLQ